MGGIFEETSNFLGLPMETFEIVASALFIFLLFLVFIQIISLRKRRGTVDLSKTKISDLKSDLEDVKSRAKMIEKERLSIVKQHEEALAKLKEAKEVILKREEDFKEYKGNFQDDTSKIPAMEEELKTYRIKLGETHKEKEKLMAKHEQERLSGEEDKKKITDAYEKELRNRDKKITTLQQQIEGELEKQARMNERRVNEIKSQTKDALMKLTKEKDLAIEDFKIENEKLSKQIEKLKEDIRVLEIEKL
jgi:chromosome segregation ATPase